MRAIQNLNSTDLIIDLLNELDSEMNHLTKVLEVIQVGIKHMPYNDKENEISSIYVLKQYIQYLQDAYVLNILDIITSNSQHKNSL